MDNTFSNKPHLGVYGDAILACIDRHMSASCTVDDLVNCCKDLVEQIGFDHFAYHSYMPSRHEGNSLYNTSINWVRHYSKNNYHLYDPRTLNAVRHNTPYCWHEFSFSDSVFGRQQAAVMRDAAEFGLQEGLTIPIHSIGSEIGVLNLSTQAGEFPPLSDADLGLLSLFALQLHDRFRNIRLTESLSDVDTVALTKREKDCMRWIAAGKTSWEIAQILDCAESTVCFHIRNVLVKLDSSNRAQAVARVVSEAHIKPYSELDDAQVTQMSTHTMRTQAKAYIKPKR